MKCKSRGESYYDNKEKPNSTVCATEALDLDFFIKAASFSPVRYNDVSQSKERHCPAGHGDIQFWYSAAGMILQFMLLVWSKHSIEPRSRVIQVINGYIYVWICSPRVTPLTLQSGPTRPCSLSFKLLVDPWLTAPVRPVIRLASFNTPVASARGKCLTAFALERAYETTGRALNGVALGLSSDHEGQLVKICINGRYSPIGVRFSSRLVAPGGITYFEITTELYNPFGSRISEEDVFHRVALEKALCVADCSVRFSIFKTGKLD
ncbi:hypothetical protein ARMGADRAFT_1040420 [Armillaria gallica]|uniref:Uncharacterized protein n=1 Tax=Armillaria gallica TaxID=47427 RepID=A0A2H3CA44_ARMGA|nr:hypothetical protein ARMGADRAFT_1040420 [Armillaria gallica]